MNKPIFVFDCNAVISAHLLPQSVSRIAYEKALEKGILIRSPDTYAEFSSRFLRRCEYVSKGAYKEIRPYGIPYKDLIY